MIMIIIIIILLSDGQAALSEVSLLRSSLKKSEEQVALLAAHHDKIGSLEVENAKLHQTNESQKKEIDDLRKVNENLLRTQEGHNKELEELRKVKAELEKSQNDLRDKMEKMKSAFEQQVCDGGAAVLAVAKSHYRAINPSVVSSGFNCRSTEEVEALMAETKPDCTVLLQNLGLTSLSDEEE
jgi:chromosome segregation ATPase